jgi:hypothetical protein
LQGRKREARRSPAGGGPGEGHTGGRAWQGGCHAFSPNPRNLVPTSFVLSQCPLRGV